MDSRKDLVKLYHPDGQREKEVATAANLVMDAMYWNGCPAGAFSKVHERYNYSLPQGIVVYGDTDFKRYRFKGPAPINPEKDTYTDNVGKSWVRLDGCCDAT